jgi:hypothetical protein
VRIYNNSIVTTLIGGNFTVNSPFLTVAPLKGTALITLGLSKEL